MLDVGALTTITPAWVAAVMSTLSSPTPARATTLRRCALRRSPRRRPGSPSGPGWRRRRRSPASSCARSAPSQYRISKSGPSASTVAGLSSSAIRTMGLLTIHTLFTVHGVDPCGWVDSNEAASAPRGARRSPPGHRRTPPARADAAGPARGHPVVMGAHGPGDHRNDEPSRVVNAALVLVLSPRPPAELGATARATTAARPTSLGLPDVRDPHASPATDPADPGDGAGLADATRRCVMVLVELRPRSCRRGCPAYPGLPEGRTGALPPP